jgi:hypothetical protein
MESRRVDGLSFTFRSMEPDMLEVKIDGIATNEKADFIRDTLNEL